MKHHALKTIPPYFEDIHSEQKKFEIRKDDRGFEVGDMLILKEWIWDEERYTGKEMLAKVKYIMRDFPGLEHGYCAMGISVLSYSTEGVPWKEGD